MLLYGCGVAAETHVESRQERGPNLLAEKRRGKTRRRAARTGVELDRGRGVAAVVGVLCRGCSAREWKGKDDGQGTRGSRGQPKAAPTGFTSLSSPTIRFFSTVLPALGWDWRTSTEANSLAEAARSGGARLCVHLNLAPLPTDWHCSYSSAPPSLPSLPTYANSRIVVTPTSFERDDGLLQRTRSALEHPTQALCV